MISRRPQAGETWVNQKNQTAFFLKIGKHTETKAEMAIFEDVEGNWLVKPLSLFLRKYSFQEPVINKTIQPTPTRINLNKI